MVDGDAARTTFTVAETKEIRGLLDELPRARLAVERMSLARLRRMKLSIAAQPQARPTRAQFEELVTSGVLRIDQDGNTAGAMIRPRTHGHIFRVAVGVTEKPVDETWNAFDQRYHWIGARSRLVTSGAHLFVLAVGVWKSAVVGLYETVSAGADRLPGSPDPDRWPLALGVRPLAAILPPDAVRVEEQQGPRSGLPERVPEIDAQERLYQALAGSLPPPGPRSLEQRIQELQWQDVAPDVLQAVHGLGRDAYEPAIIARAIEIGGWSTEELKARAWYTGSGAGSHIEHILGQALRFELASTRNLQRRHRLYSRTSTTPAPTFGVAYRRAGGNEAVAVESPAHPIDLDELERATRRHMDLQDHLADALRRHDVEPRSPGSWQPQFDLAFEHAGKCVVVEVKSGDPASAQQVRLGIGQVLEYRHLLCERTSREVHSVLLLEAEPPHPWDTLAAAVGVRLLRADRLDESLSTLLYDIS